MPRGELVWTNLALRQGERMGSPLGRKHRIAIVDDHAIVRDGLKFQLAAHPDLELCGEAEGVESGFALTKEVRPDLVIIDISLKDGNGIELIKRIKQYDKKIKMLVTTMYNESLYGERSLRAGADGYINKQDSREMIIEAIRMVLSGRRFLSAKLTDRLVGQAVEGVNDIHTSSVDLLSNRELEVFQLIGEGLTTGAIARKLFLSPHTIDTHREKIKSKLGLKNSGELQREAVQWVLENG